MKHSLDEINAAVKLGDRFFPPPGVIFETLVYICNELTRVAVIVVKKDPSGSGRFFGVMDLEQVEVQAGFVSTIIWRYEPSEIDRVIFVPSKAPPFKEWKRWA